MGKDLKSIPLTGLVAIQQAIEFGTHEIHAFFGQVEKDWQENKVSSHYYETLKKNISGRITKNNEAVKEIESEIFTRMEKAVGRGITTPKIMPSLVRRYEDELAKHSKIHKSSDAGKGSTPVLDLSTGDNVEQ